jgi:hypothetical protein
MSTTPMTNVNELTDDELYQAAWDAAKAAYGPEADARVASGFIGHTQDVFKFGAAQGFDEGRIRRIQRFFEVGVLVRRAGGRYALIAVTVAQEGTKVGNMLLLNSGNTSVSLTPVVGALVAVTKPGAAKVETIDVSKHVGLQIADALNGR